jgi:hypothetical protein
MKPKGGEVWNGPGMVWSAVVCTAGGWGGGILGFELKVSCLLQVLYHLNHTFCFIFHIGSLDFAKG